jgi:hypothetical protein
LRATPLVVAALSLGLTACETTAERSAKLERSAKHLAAGRSAAPATTAFTRPSTVVTVLAAKLVHSSEGAAAIVTLRNTSSVALQSLPIAISVKDAAGRTVFQNNASGLEAALASLPSIAPHATLTWVHDQVPPGGSPTTVTARVGEAQARAGNVPSLPVTGLHLVEDPTNGVGALGTVTNTSSLAQRNLVVFVLAAKGGTTVAAGRAVLPEVAAHSVRTFTAFFIGEPKGAQLRADAPATSSG